MSVRQTVRLGLLLVALLFLAAPVHAQVPPAYAVNVSVSGPADALGPGDCGTAQVTVQNLGNSPVPAEHVIKLQASALPAGWSYDPALPAEVRLPGGATGTYETGVCAPNDLDGATAPTVTVRATVDSDFASPKASDEATFEVTTRKKPLFGLDIPDSFLFIVLGGLAALILIVILTRKRQKNAVTISCREAVKDVIPGRGTSFPVRIRNDGSERDLVNLAASAVPPGWDLFLPLADLALDAREEQTVWLSVRAAEAAHPGEEIPIRVTATSTGSGGDQATIELRTRVVGSAPTPPPGEAVLDQEESVYETERPVAVKRRRTPT